MFTSGEKNSIQAPDNGNFLRITKYEMIAGSSEIAGIEKVTMSNFLTICEDELVADLKEQRVIR